MCDETALCQGCSKKTPSHELELCEVWRLGTTYKFLCKKCRTKKEMKKAYEKWRKDAHEWFKNKEEENV